MTAPPGPARHARLVSSPRMKGQGDTQFDGKRPEIIVGRVVIRPVGNESRQHQAANPGVHKSTRLSRRFLQVKHRTNSRHRETIGVRRKDLDRPVVVGSGKRHLEHGIRRRKTSLQSHRREDDFGCDSVRVLIGHAPSGVPTTRLSCPSEVCLLHIDPARHLPRSETLNQQQAPPVDFFKTGHAILQRAGTTLSKEAQRLVDVRISRDEAKRIGFGHSNSRLAIYHVSA